MADLSRKRIITCAITGAIHTPTMSGALPYTVVINPAGTIVLRHLGRLPHAKLEAVLAQNTQP